MSLILSPNNARFKDYDIRRSIKKTSDAKVLSAPSAVGRGLCIVFLRFLRFFLDVAQEPKVRIRRGAFRDLGSNSWPYRAISSGERRNKPKAGHVAVRTSSVFTDDEVPPIREVGAAPGRVGPGRGGCALLLYDDGGGLWSAGRILLFYYGFRAAPIRLNRESRSLRNWVARTRPSDAAKPEDGAHSLVHTLLSLCTCLSVPDKVMANCTRTASSTE